MLVKQQMMGNSETTMLTRQQQWWGLGTRDSGQWDWSADVTAVITATKTVIMVKQQDGRNNNNDRITTKTLMLLNRATSLWRSYSFKNSTVFSTKTATLLYPDPPFSG